MECVLKCVLAVHIEHVFLALSVALMMVQVSLQMQGFVGVVASHWPLGHVRKM